MVTMNHFLTQYGFVVQLVASALCVIFLGWMAKRALPRVEGEWTYSHYPLAAKLFAIAFALFLTAALIYNGAKLLDEEWWVPLVIITMFVGAYWVVYEMFVTTLRWNSLRMEISRPPLKPKAVRFADITSIDVHSASESITIRAKDGTKVWFPHSFRSGMPELFAALAAGAGAHGAEDSSPV